MVCRLCALSYELDQRLKNQQHVRKQYKGKTTSRWDIKPENMFDILSKNSEKIYFHELTENKLHSKLFCALGKSKDSENNLN